MLVGILNGLFFLVVVAICYSIILETRVEMALPLSCFSIILFMYICGLFDWLGIKVWIGLLSFAIILAVISITKVRRGLINRNSIKELFFSPGLIVFTLLTIALVWFTKDVQVFQWDEFSHWATTVKAMRYNDTLSVYDNAVTAFPSYPPGMALWQYLFQNFSLRYDDTLTIFAYDIYLVLMMIPAATAIKWKKSSPFFAILLSGLIYLIPYFYYNPWDGCAWRCVYIDRALAFTMGSAGLVAFIYKMGLIEKKETMLYLILNLSVLTLLKSTGIVFAAFFIILLIVDDCMTRSSERKIGLANTILIIVIICTANCSWKVFLRIKGVVELWATGSDVVNRIKLLLSGNEEGWRYDVIAIFLNAIKEKSSFFTGLVQVSYIGWIFVWLVLGIIICFNCGRAREKTYRIIIDLLVVVVEYCVFEVSMLYVYLYQFYQSDSLALVGFSRYSANYHLGITMAMILLLFVVNLVYDKYCVISMALASAVIICIVPWNQVNKDITNHEQAIQEGYRISGFSNYVEVEKKYKDLLTNNDKVCIISDYSMAEHILKKAFIPAKAKWITQEEIMKEDSFDIFMSNEDVDFLYVSLSKEAEIVGWDAFAEECPYLEGMYKVIRNSESDKISFEIQK